MSQTYGIGLNDKRRDEMIHHFEESGKFNPNAYQDSEGIWTIGWGFTQMPDGRAVKAGDTMTAEDGSAHYRKTVSDHVKNLRALPNYNRYNPNQQAALEAAGYNFGPNFLSSPNFKTLAKAIKANDLAGVTKALRLYTNGETPGLVRRRGDEVKLFNTPWEDPQKVPPSSSVALRPDKNKPNAKSNPILNGLKIINPVLGNIPKLLKIR